RGQRLYSGAQVRKLGLLKQLVDQGHAISVLARLSGEQLQELAAGTQARPQAEGPLRATVIGGSLAQRIAASGREGLDLIVQGSYPHLEQASGQSLDAATEVVVIEQSELHDSALPLIMAVRDACQGAAVVVLYRFCASATIRALRAQGC